MWIDADIQFDPAAVDQLRAHNLPIVAGIYVKKGQRKLASHVLPGTKEIVFGKEGGLLEIRFSATGFLLTHRQVYETIREHWALPECNRLFGRPTVPYFMPMVLCAQEPRTESQSPPSAEQVSSAVAGQETANPSSAAPPELVDTHWYLAEDFAFSHRARSAGFKIFADTTIRLGHLGTYGYSWEDAGGSNPQRFATYRFKIT